MHDFKLSIELVPETVWFSNLRLAMSRKNWDIIRLQTYKDYNHSCGICGCHPDRLECHEIWWYDDIDHIQHLKGFIALCVLCHNVKHIGLSAMKAIDRLLDYKDIENHFLKVNNCTYSDFISYRDKAFQQWDERSKFEWKQDFGIYSKLIK